MKVIVTFKMILLHVIIAAILLFLIDVVLYYFMNLVIPNWLDWINNLHFLIKLLLLIAGEIILLLIARRIALFGGRIFDKLPENSFTKISTTLMSIVNTIVGIIILWRMPEKYNFWIVFELLILTSFLCVLNAIVFSMKTQMKEYAKL